MKVLYCENDDCQVLVYQTETFNNTFDDNCPACGRFGRIKGKQ